MGRRPLPDDLRRKRLCLYVTDTERAYVIKMLNEYRLPIEVQEANMTALLIKAVQEAGIQVVP